MQDHPDPVPALYDELVDRKYNRACILWSDGTHGYAIDPYLGPEVVEFGGDNKARIHSPSPIGNVQESPLIKR